MLVRFSGPGGTAPATLGQRNVLRWLGTDDPRGGVLPEFAEVPAGLTADDVAAALRAVVERNEALRTVFPAPGVQRVLAAGAVPLALHEAAGDLQAQVGGLVWAAMGEPFDVAAEPPVRALAVTAAGAPVLLVLLLSHVAADAAGAAIVRDQVLALLRGEPLPPPGRQPRDQAAWERTPAGERRTRAALRHWETVLRRHPGPVLPEPDPAGTPGQREVRMRSAALGPALAAVTARTGAGPGTVLLAATLTLVAARTGRPAGAVVAICGNRFRGGWRDYVGPLAQDALLPYEVAPGAGFDALVGQVRGATLAAYRHAHFDAPALWAVIDAVGPFARDLVFNDLGARTDGAAAPGTGVTGTVLDPLPARDLPTRLLVTLGGVAGAEVDLRAHADTRYVPDVEGFLLDVERLVATAGPGR